MSVTGFGRIAMADRMSVNQLKEALQNKTLPAYIAIPLIEEKLDMQQRMMQAGAMQQAQAQPPIADQVMQRADAQGIAALPTSLPAASMAGGGIVAFADGGEADDDEDEYSFADDKLDRENEALVMRLMGMQQMGLGQGISLPPAASRTAESAPMGIDSLGTGLRTTTAVGEPEPSPVTSAPPAITLSSAKEERSTGLRMPSGHKYEDRIVKQAERMGVDPEFALKIAMKETGGLKNPETAKSRAGALGIMQLMPGTAKDMGVTDPFDPEQNIAGGLRYAKLMLDKYKDPKLAAIAYNWGPGNTDKWLTAGADMSKLPRETRNYVANLKEGGAIRFQNEGLVADPLFNAGGTDFGVMQRNELVDAMTLAELQEYNRTGLIPERLSGKVGNRDIGRTPMFGTTTQRSDPAKFVTPPAPPKYTSQDYQAMDEAQGMQEGVTRGETPVPVDSTLAAAAKTLEGGAPAQTEENLLEKLLSQREKNITQQRQQDKYMALLAAGLGMMGGTSRYAAQNIGQGALQGIASMQAANKLRAAEENALLSGRLGQYRIGQTEALRKQILDREQMSKFTQQLSTARDRMIKNVAAAKKMDLGSITDPKLLATIESQADAMLARDPAYQAIYKRLYGTDFAPSTAPTAPVDYTKKYGLTARN